MIGGGWRDQLGRLARAQGGTIVFLFEFSTMIQRAKGLVS